MVELNDPTCRTGLALTDHATLVLHDTYRLVGLAICAGG